jgi:hypothetical protein
MERRVLLAGAAVCALSGCLEIDRLPQSRLAWVWLQNDREKRYAVDVAIEDGDELVYSDAFQLPPTEAETTDIRITSPVEGPGQYIVRATMDGETHEVDTTALVGGDENCIGVRFSLLTNGNVDYWTKSMQQC